MTKITCLSPPLAFAAARSDGPIVECSGLPFRIHCGQSPFQDGVDDAEGH